jgi:polar amino acid transport system substrate-binding protein
VSRSVLFRRSLCGLSCAFLSFALAACSSSGSQAGTPSSAAGSSAAGTAAGGSAVGLPAATVKNAAIINGLAEDPAAAALVPVSWRAKGTLEVASNATYAPDEFVASDNSTIVGWDPDLGHALAKLLGLKFQFVNTQFDEIIPGLAANRYDLGMSSASVKPDREKVVDFVTDFEAGYAFMVPAGSSVRPVNIAALCGVTVAVEEGSVEAAAAQQQATACAQGKTLSIQAYPDQNAVNLALSSNRAQVAFADSPVIAYQAKLSQGKFTQSGGVLQAGPEGIEIPKGNAGMDKALQAAMTKLISSGAYRKILSNWGAASGAITQSQIDAPGSGNAS